MKRLLIILMFVPFVAIGQQIEKETDAFTGETKYKVNGYMGERGNYDRSFTIIPSIRKNNHSFIAAFDGINACNERNEMIFVFENNDRVVLHSFNKFNCKNVAYFNITKKQSNLFATYRLTMIRFKNGRSGQTIDVTEVENPDYFINLYKNIFELGL